MAAYNPLTKKYKCDDCGKFFRTLQGLSGHKQFLHGTPSVAPSPADLLIEISQKQTVFQVFVKTAGLSDEYSQKINAALDSWKIIGTYLLALGLPVTNNDLKQFILSSLKSP